MFDTPRHHKEFARAKFDYAVTKLVAMETKNLSLLKDTESLPGLKSGNFINRAGADHLKAAARGLLFRERLSSKLSVSTARQALIEGFAAHLPKALKKKVLSEHAVIAKAVEILKMCPRDDGTSLFPRRLRTAGEGHGLPRRRRQDRRQTGARAGTCERLEPARERSIRNC